MCKNCHKSAGIAGGILAGLAAGAALGLLFAPKSGKETRADIKKKADEAAKKGKALYEEYSDKVESEAAKLKSKVNRATKELKK